MRVKRLLFVALIAFPMMSMAQSRYEEVNDSTPKTKLENMKVNAAYQQWLGQYEEVGRKINDISEQYQREVDKRGYPKKKTVQRKIELVSQYIDLLKQQRDTPDLIQNLDTETLNSKISMWQSQLDGLTALLKKI